MVQDYLNAQYSNPSTLPSKSHFYTPIKWDADRLFKHKNKDAIKAKQEELAATNPLLPGQSRVEKAKMDFGKYYQEAVRKVKDDIGPEGMADYQDEARRLNNGDVPAEIQAKWVISMCVDIRSINFTQTSSQL